MVVVGVNGRQGRKGGGGGDPPLPTERKVHFLGNSRFC